MSSGSADPTVHRLKITLQQVRPAPWRRLVVPSDATLGDLSDVLRAVFGWSPVHLHLFAAQGRQFGPSELVEDSWGADYVHEDTVPLGHVASRAGTRLDYIYDLGDCWEHLIEVEAVEPAEPGAAYPRCPDGKGLAPEEDTGEERPGVFDPVATDKLLQSYGWTAGPLHIGDPLFSGIVPGFAAELSELSADERPQLGPVPPVPAERLAAAAAEAPLLTGALALARLVGSEGRTLTPKGVLRPTEAQEIARTLGLPDQHTPTDPYSPGKDVPRPPKSAAELTELHRLWTCAVEAGLIEAGRSKARAGDAVRGWDTTAPERRLELWNALFAALLRVRATPEAGRGKGLWRSRPPLGGTLLTAAALLLESGPQADPAPAAVYAIGLADAEGPAGTLGLDSLLDDFAAITGDLIEAGALVAAAPGDPRRRSHEEDLRAVTAEIRAGALSGTDLARRLEDSPWVSLTELGRHGLRLLLVAHGWQQHELGEASRQGPGDLLDVIHHFSPEAGRLEAEAWLTARPDSRTALDELLAAARGKHADAARRRLTVAAAVTAAGPETAVPALRACAGDRWLDALAAEQLHLLDAGPEPTPAQRLWAEVDTLSTLLGEDPDSYAEAVAASPLPELLATPAGMAAVARVDHPHARKVLTRAAAALPDRALAQQLRAAVGGERRTGKKKGKRSSRAVGRRRH